jgi:hypothetical protein
VEPKKSEERESEQEVRWRTADVPADNDRSQLPQAPGVEVVNVSQDIIEI